MQMVHGSRHQCPQTDWLRPNQVSAALTECLDGLPDQQRAVFHFREVEGLSTSEVSELIGCTGNHVGVLFHRARTRLRACLERKAGERHDEDL